MSCQYLERYNICTNPCENKRCKFHILGLEESTRLLNKFQNLVIGTNTVCIKSFSNIHRLYLEVYNEMNYDNLDMFDKMIGNTIDVFNNINEEALVWNLRYLFNETKMLLNNMFIKKSNILKEREENFKEGVKEQMKSMIENSGIEKYDLYSKDVLKIIESHLLINSL